MSRDIHLHDLPELAARLNLTFQSGHISLEGQRMVLLHTHALAALRKELADTLGMDRTRGVLTRMGYASGQRDARMVREIMPEATDNDLMNLGPQLHSLEGIVNARPLQFEIDVVAGTYRGDFLWENSHEADLHLQQFGPHDDVVCWTQIGYASGYTSELMRRQVVFRELECRGCGSDHCRIEGRLVEDWGDEIQAELRYYEPEHVADQLVDLQTQVEHLRYSLDEQLCFGDLVGQSTAFVETRELVSKAATSDVTVLLLGETGVGKELFARAIHQASPRSEEAFVAINCAAIPEELLEAELFGAEKGAFTGAQKTREGRFERAHGGTLFLDEVGELSPAAQAKLLRVLQEGEYERVGDSRTRKTDVRLIAATNVDLARAAKKQQFRNDLYYRLSTFPVLIPPLRDRRADIPLLVERFLGKYNARHGKRVTELTEDALAALKRYDWPGNIRELENMIERGVIVTASGQAIETRSLFPPMMFEGQFEADESTTDESERDELSKLLIRALEQTDSLDQLEEQLILGALDRANGNLSAAARELGITRAKLSYRLQKIRQQ